MTSRPRVAVRVLVALASVLLIAATVSAYAWRALLDSEQFATRATAAVQDASVRTVIAERVTDRLVLSRQADLLAVRPIIASAVSGVVGGEAFGSLLHRAARDVHRSVFARDQDTVTLTLVDVGTVAGEALEEVRPQLAAEIRSTGRIDLLKRDVGNVTGDLARLFDRTRVLAYLLAGLTLAAGAAALVVSADRRHTAARLGLGVVVAGVVIVVGEMVARTVVLGRVGDPDATAAAGAVWDAFLGDLRALGLVLAGIGAVVVAAAEGVIRPVAIEGPLRGAWRIVSTEPASTRLRLARGAALVVAGVVMIVEPLTVLRACATLVGVYVLYLGVATFLRAIQRPPAAGADTTARRPVRRLAVPAVAALLIAAAVAAFVGAGGVDEPRAAISTCNGHAELCDRPLDEVVLPATHNSMSAPLPGWFSAVQERSIAEQLEDGVRGLLLDTHYADTLANGRTRTYFASSADIRRAIQQDGVSEQSVRAARRLRDRLGFRGEGKRGVFLCHTFCELGATLLTDALRDIRAFLVTHPSDVIVVVNQDHVPPGDFVEAIRDAGLGAYVLEPRSRSPWPTLREMIEQDRRLVVLAENRAGAAPWYRHAYDGVIQETPYSFAGRSELIDEATLEASCRPNRGTPGAPLLLVNHWINTDPVPRPGNAAAVNAYEPLLRRARACRRARGQLPNLLAVDFYRRGDLFRVVDTLNGV